MKIIVPRYANGTSNRLPSVVYTTRWPCPATAVENPLASFVAFMVSRFLVRDSAICHFFAS